MKNDHGGGDLRDMVGDDHQGQYVSVVRIINDITAAFAYHLEQTEKSAIYRDAIIFTGIRTSSMVVPVLCVYFSVRWAVGVGGVSPRSLSGPTFLYNFVVSSVR